jgi:hypothetical protein
VQRQASRRNLGLLEQQQAVRELLLAAAVCQSQRELLEVLLPPWALLLLLLLLQVSRGAAAGLGQTATPLPRCCCVGNMAPML